MNNDLTILVQGPMHGNTIRAIPEYLKYAPVHVSTWDDHPLIKEVRDLQNSNSKLTCCPLAVGVVKPDFFNWAHNFEHAWTVREGLQAISSLNTLKVRTDALYPNLTKLIDNFRTSPNKIHTNNAFAQRDQCVKFHPTDHLWLCRTELMKRAMDFVLSACIPYYREFVGFDAHPVRRPNGAEYLVYNDVNGQKIDLKNETLFCVGFLRALGCSIDVNKSRELMHKHYFVTPLKDMKPFILNSQAHPNLTEDIFSCQPNSLTSAKEF